MLPLDHTFKPSAEEVARIIHLPSRGGLTRRWHGGSHRSAFLGERDPWAYPREAGRCRSEPWRDFTGSSSRNRFTPTCSAGAYPAGELP